MDKSAGVNRQEGINYIGIKKEQEEEETPQECEIVL